MLIIENTMKYYVSILILWMFSLNLTSSNNTPNPSITSVTPKELQRTTVRTLELTINNLPPFTGQLLCVYTIMDKILITNATRNNSGVNCTTPRTALLPSIPPGHHHYTSKLSVWTTNNPEPELVNTNITFFDCNTYTSCTSCVSSMSPCDWCVDGHRCTHDTAENCRNDILVTGVNRGGPSYRSGPKFCPAIDSTIDGSSKSEILVPAGTKKGIRVQIHIIGQFIVQTRFLCRFNIEGRVTNVNAELLGDRIYCESKEFAYDQPEANMTIPFAVTWGGSKPLDNPNDIHVVMYKCHEMADNCGKCLALEKKYGCGWCQSTSRCEVSSRCDSGSGEWLDQNHTCSGPLITNFWPQSGSWEGGTNITIRGINLGNRFQDIYAGITVAGISCVPYEHFYKLANEIVCRVDGIGTSDVRSGPVKVRVDNFSDESKQKYSFVDPKIESIFPKHGVLSGGTELTISGKYLNVGNLVEVFIDELPCKILTNNESEIKCITSASDKEREGLLTMKFDQGVRTYKEEFFKYHADCSSYTSCTTCVTSSTPCDWCVDGHRCTYDTAENCRNDILVTGVNRGGPSYRGGPTFCPKINSTIDGSSEILVPAGTKKAISVKVHIVGQFIVQTRFLCQFNIEGRLGIVNAVLLSDTIYCDAKAFAYTQSVPKITATFAVIWGGSKPLDNPSDVRVVVYKCSEMAKSSNECSVLEGKYNCVWCQSTNSCELNNQCKNT